MKIETVRCIKVTITTTMKEGFLKPLQDILGCLYAVVIF